MNYHNRKFRPVSNTENAETTEETIFHYQQEENRLFCDYSGGNIIKGHLLGLVDGNGIINMRYHQVNSKGNLMTGTCISTPEKIANGKIRLHEEWQWTSGDCSKGSSILEEL
ncbi:n-acetylglutamate synthase [Cytophaga sp. FL35]|uniref:n-acetylglutamate synthase n=1 Tax=Cytophaga sp. FL35 TaxID=1904456 RepID=UPI001653B72D|nr:n-acetylglutamate synthase [Cytophaga sp. FL35]MBC6998803.1 n-acetylglutamate synthase [Cytophaga sp. FL35]